MKENQEGPKLLLEEVGSVNQKNFVTALEDFKLQIEESEILGHSEIGLLACVFTFALKHGFGFAMDGQYEMNLIALAEEYPDQPTYEKVIGIYTKMAGRVVDSTKTFLATMISPQPPKDKMDLYSIYFIHDLYNCLDLSFDRGNAPRDGLSLLIDFILLHIERKGFEVSL
jgi:hypothetical protein